MPLANTNSSPAGPRSVTSKLRGRHLHLASTGPTLDQDLITPQLHRRILNPNGSELDRFRVIDGVELVAVRDAPELHEMQPVIRHRPPRTLRSETALGGLRLPSKPSGDSRVGGYYFARETEAAFRTGGPLMPLQLVPAWGERRGCRDATLNCAALHPLTPKATGYSAGDSTPLKLLTN